MLTMSIKFICILSSVSVYKCECERATHLIFPIRSNDVDAEQFQHHFIVC